MDGVPNIRMDGKVALITGGGQIISRRIADAYTAMGAYVYIAPINESQDNDTSAALSRSESKISIIRAIFRKKPQVKSIMDRIIKEYGRLDVLVNYMGDSLEAKNEFEHMTEEEWDDLYKTNLRYLFMTTRAALPVMRASGQGGSIITITSMEGSRGMPYGVVYAAFKMGVVGFTKSLAIELGPEGIRVNAIALDNTKITQISTSGPVASKKLGHINNCWPLGRGGTSGDVASCATFLATDLSAWVSGTAIHLNGGAQAAGGFYRSADGSWTNKPVIERCDAYRQP